MLFSLLGRPDAAGTIHWDVFFRSVFAIFLSQELSAWTSFHSTTLVRIHSLDIFVGHLDPPWTIWRPGPCKRNELRVSLTRLSLAASYTEMNPIFPNWYGIFERFWRKF